MPTELVPTGKKSSSSFSIVSNQTQEKKKQTLFSKSAWKISGHLYKPEQWESSFLFLKQQQQQKKKEPYTIR